MSCKDCGSKTRKLTQVSAQVALCASCKRARKKAQSQAAHARRILATYNLTAEEYDALLVEQGGRCAICRRATGKTKRLAVDHDHATGAVRGLVCFFCNNMLGHIRDSIDTATRVIHYLAFPPYARIKAREQDPDIPIWSESEC